MDTSLTMLSQSHRRTLADIRNKVAKRSMQNAISRAFHAKSDSQAIASWKIDLNRILLVFNVRSVASVPLSVLTVQSQTELGLNIYGAISNVRDGATKTHTVVVDTYAMVSEIRRGMQTTSATECTLTAAQTKSRSATPATVGRNVLYLHLARLASRLPRRQGPVSDVTS